MENSQASWVNHWPSPRWEALPPGPGSTLYPKLTQRQMGVALHQPPVLVTEGVSSLYQHFTHVACCGARRYLHRPAGPILAIHFYYLHPRNCR